MKKYGVPHEEIFQTADLFERRNIPQVVISIFSLGRMVSYNAIKLLYSLPNKVGYS